MQRDIKVNTRSATGQLEAMLRDMPEEQLKFHAEVGELVESKALELFDRRVVKNPRAPRTGRLRASYAKKVNQFDVLVEEGEGVEYAKWWEFGGSTHSPRGNTDRKIVKGGRTLWAAYRAVRPVIHELAERRLEALERHFHP